MQRLLGFRKDNRGDTLVIVIVGILLLGILGAAVLASASMNYSMKNIDKNQKKNFYSAEEALDIIYAGVGEDVMESMKFSYTYVLNHMLKEDGSGGLATVDNEELNKVFRSVYYYYLTGEVPSASDPDKPQDWNTVYYGTHNDGIFYTCTPLYRNGAAQQLDLQNHLIAMVPPVDSSKATLTVKIPISTPTVPKTAITFADKVVQTSSGADVTLKYFTIKDVEVTYTSLSSGVSSRVSTDIVVEMPLVDINFSQVSTMDYGDLFKYIIVAEGDAVSGTTPTMQVNTSADITGNIYAGKQASEKKDGIYLNGTSLNITAENVSTSGELKLRNGRFSLDSAAAGNSKLWAKNISTLGNQDEFLLTNTDCVVKDDLEVNGNASKVKISGNYFGIGFRATDATNMTEANSTENDAMYFSSTGNGIYDANGMLMGTLTQYEHTQSSAVVVNGTDAEVDFSGLKNLLLGGRAYVDLIDPDAGLGENNSTYMTGESISVRGNQEAYLADLGDSKYFNIGSVNPGPTPTQNYITFRLHYFRSDGNYDDWNIWLWFYGQEGTDYFFEEGQDGEMVMTMYMLPGSTPRIGYIVKKWDWSKQENGDTYVEIPDDMVKGTIDVYVNSKDNNNPTPAQRDITFRLHYSRPDGNYNDWNAWLWTLPANAGSAYPFEQQNGEMVATMHIQSGSETQVGFIVRKGEWAAQEGGNRYINIPADMTKGTIDAYVQSGDTSTPTPVYTYDNTQSGNTGNTGNIGDTYPTEPVYVRETPETGGTTGGVTAGLYATNPITTNPVTYDFYQSTVRGKDVLRAATVAKKVGNNVYFYRASVNPVEQTKAFEDYFNLTATNKALIRQKVDSLGLKSLLIGNTTNILSVGAIMSVDNTKTATQRVQVLNHTVENGNSPMFGSYITDLNLRYKAMLTELKDYGNITATTVPSNVASAIEAAATTGTTPITTYVDSAQFIEATKGNLPGAGITSDTDGDGVFDTYIASYDFLSNNLFTDDERQQYGLLSDNEATVVLTSRDYTIDAHTKDSGVIIAAGNVTVTKDFTGLILCSGDIIIDNGAPNATVTLTACSKLVRWVAGKDQSLNACLKGYLSATSGEEGGDPTGSVTISDIKYQDLVSYSNWNKLAINN